MDIPLIEYITSKKKPIIMSTGMGTLEEITDAVNAVGQEGKDRLCLLRCASAYPAISSSMNLKTMVDMKERFGVPVGLSDHSLGSVGAVAAVAMGASVIEKHFCISREIKNPDSSFSMEAAEFKSMVNDIREAEKARGVINYGATPEEEENVVFRRSIFAVKDIKQGEMFTEENIRVIRPGYGMKPKYYKEILGKKAGRDIQRGMPLNEELF